MCGHNPVQLHADDTMKPIAIVPVFQVRNLNAAVRFYTKVLGFTESFRYGTYVGLRMGSCEIHVCPPDADDSRVGGGNAYLICDDVDAYFRKIKAAGARVTREPGDRVYGMRDFVVLDPDGNRLTFGCDSGTGD